MAGKSAVHSLQGDCVCKVYNDLRKACHREFATEKKCIAPSMGVALIIRFKFNPQASNYGTGCAFEGKRSTTATRMSKQSAIPRNYMYLKQ